MKMIFIIALISICFPAFSEEGNGPGAYQNGKDFGFDFTGGIRGVYADWSVGIVFPKIRNVVTFGMKAVHSTTFTDQMIFDAGGLLKDRYTSMAVSGGIWMSAGSPLLFGFVRMYGLTEFMFGYSFMPEIADHYGNNFTFGGYGFGGIEFYTGRWSCFFIEAGGGGAAIFGEFNNQYIADNGRIGSGFAVRSGTRIFIAGKKTETDR